MAIHFSALRFDSTAKDVDPLRQAVSRVILAWSHVENGLTDLLAAIIRDPSHYVASAILFTPNNIETRVDIADNAFRAFLLDHGSIREPAMDIWATIINALNRLRKTRNKVAHGQMMSVSRDGGKAHVRLMAPLLDFRGLDFPEDQLPGMSANDIEQSARKIEYLYGPISIMRRALEAIDPPAYESSLKILAELKVAIQMARDPHNPIQG